MLRSSTSRTSAWTATARSPFSPAAWRSATGTSPSAPPTRPPPPPRRSSRRQTRSDHLGRPQAGEVVRREPEHPLVDLGVMLTELGPRMPNGAGGARELHGHARDHQLAEPWMG